MELFKNAAEKLEKEYRCFLDYLDGEKVVLAPKSGNIGKKACMELNRRFSIVNERYKSDGRTQDYYAVIDFFYFFSVRSRILQVTKKRGTGLVMQPGVQYERFFKLSAIERYILMMSVWIGEYEEARENRSWLFSTRELFVSLVYQEANAVIKIPYDYEDSSVWGEMYLPSLRLAALFHLIEIEWLDEQEEDQENKFRIREIYATSEVCVLREIFKKQDHYFWYIKDMESVLSVLSKVQEEDAEGIEMHIMEFWANPVDSGLQTIVFKVKVGSCVRSIQMGDQYTLDDLHFLIQKSVDFDMDHLYYFQIGKGSSKIRYFAPQCEDERYLADTVMLAELQFVEGMEFEYLFDFGDQWRFSITVSKILQRHTEECEIRNVKGENPEQYEWYD